LLGINRSYALVLDAFLPNKVLSKNAVRLMVGVQLAVVLLLWTYYQTVFLPKPGDILRALNFLWTQEGLGIELLTSFFLNLEAIGIATVVSLLLAYSSLLPFFRPIITVLSKLRFLSMVGLTFFFTLMAANGHALRVELLVFSISVFFVTGMASVIDSAPKEKFDLARTLGMNEWRTSLEVVVLGESDQALDMLRQNAAMGWMMLTMVEGLSRGGGGIGTLLLDNSKYFHLDAVFAIQITILLIGLGQDYAIGALRRMICPWADLTLERRT
jgi:NitT/TauT family transport system permease protein